MFLLHLYIVNSHTWNKILDVWMQQKHTECTEIFYGEFTWYIHILSDTNIPLTRLKSMAMEAKETVFSLEYTSLKSQDCPWQCKAEGRACTEGEKWRKYQAYRPYHSPRRVAASFQRKSSLEDKDPLGVHKYPLAAVLQNNFIMNVCTRVSSILQTLGNIMLETKYQWEGYTTESI